MIDLFFVLLLPAFAGVGVWLVVYILARAVINLFISLVEAAFGI